MSKLMFFCVSGFSRLCKKWCLLDYVQNGTPIEKPIFEIFDPKMDPKSWISRILRILIKS